MNTATTTPPAEENHAISNARGWLSTIVELHDRQTAAEEEGDDDAADSVREEINESPLSIQVRSGWYSPGAEGAATKPEEFEILLSTGGPALRIIGELDEYGQPYGEPALQWQDWGTPWTTYRQTTEAEDEALQAFVSNFWFGE